MDKPEYGKQYRLTGGKGEKAISNGNTWMESLVQDLKPTWCECKIPRLKTGAEDNACPCGVEKHHYHCECNGIFQIG